MTNKQEGKSSSSNNIIFQDYWLDFIGGLLPGALFLLVVTIIVFPVIITLYYSIVQPEDMHIIHYIQTIINILIKVPNMLWFMIISILFLIIFVIGHIFYRKDPKLPDQESFRKILKYEAKKNNIDISEYLKDIDDPKYSEFLISLKKNFGCTSITNCEFPYPYLSEYIEERGLSHLNNYIIWKEDIKKRSKNIINILKLRIRFFYPERATTIVRNEAHVRLASSLWYASKIIKTIILTSALVLILGIVIVLIIHYQEGKMWELYSSYFAQSISILLILSILYIAFYLAKVHIESFFHYQRRREVIYLLETAWVAFSNDAEWCLPFCQEAEIT